MRNYARIVDRIATAVTYDATISSATSVTLNANTKWVRISAIDKGIFVRKQAGVTSALWDWFVPANTTLDLIIPTGVTVLSFLEETATAKLALSEFD